MAWPAIIGAIASIGGSLLANNSNRRREKKMWDANNRYNHPSMQMARLKEAGLNPHLVYGQSASGATGSSSSPAPSDKLELKNEYFDQLSQYVGSQKQEQEMSNLQKQLEVMNADIALKGSQQAQQDATTARSKFDLSQADRLKDISAQAAQQNLINSTKTGANIDANTDKLIADTALSQTNKKVSEQNIKESQQRINESKERIKNYYVDRNYKKIETEIKRIELQLRKIGINPNDPAGHRILGRVLDETGMVDGTIDFLRDGASSIKTWWQNLKKSK